MSSSSSGWTPAFCMMWCGIRICVLIMTLRAILKSSSKKDSKRRWVRRRLIASGPRSAKTLSSCITLTWLLTICRFSLKLALRLQRICLSMSSLPHKSESKETHSWKLTDNVCVGTSKSWYRWSSAWVHWRSWIIYAVKGTFLRSSCKCTW